MTHTPKERYPHLLSAELMIDGETVHGQVTNWSPEGIQLLSAEPLREAVSYRIQFFLERNRFGEEIEFTEGTWEREGNVVWTFPYREGCWIGIEFDTTLDLPFEEIDDFFTARDFCHIAIFSESDQGLRPSSFDPQLPIEFNQVVQLPAIDRQWYLWTLWGIIVLLEIWILVLLFRR